MHKLHQSVLTFPKYWKQKFWRGVKKLRKLKIGSESLSCKIWILNTQKIRLDQNHKPSIPKIERVREFFVITVEVKSQYCAILKSQNLIQFLRFESNFACDLHFYRGLNSILASNTTPSFTFFLTLSLTEGRILWLPRRDTPPPGFFFLIFWGNRHFC